MKSPGNHFPMNGTVTGKILAAHSTGSPPEPGSKYLDVSPDLVLGHDATFSLLLDDLQRLGGSGIEPERLLLTVDHFAPPSTIERAAILRKFLDACKNMGLGEPAMLEGICHQLLLEDNRLQPGSLVVGADSHTVTAGAVGALCTGYGSTDILAVIRTGRIKMKAPEVVRAVITGKFNPNVDARDLALEMLRVLGEDGALYRSIEFEDLTECGLQMDDRAAVCNMAVETGAKFALFIPDAETRRFLVERDGAANADGFLRPDTDADYVDTMNFDLSGLQPLVAIPSSPANVKPVAELEKVNVNQVFIGSCAGGRLNDLYRAAQVLDGRKIAPGVRLVVTPASRKVWLEASKMGILDKLVNAGAAVTNPSCGACGGIDKGILAAGEVCVSTSNRNFSGRMGHKDARIYLAGPIIATASALAGYIAGIEAIQ